MQWRVHKGAAHTCDMSSPCCSDSLSTRRHLNCKASGLGGRSEAVWQCGSLTGGWVVRWAEGVGQIELGSLHCMAAPLHPPATHRFEGEEHEEREGAGPGGNDHEAQQLHAQLAPAAAVEHAPVVGVAVCFDGGGLQAGRGRCRWRRWVCGLRRGAMRQGRAGQCRGHRRAVQMGRVDSHSSAVGQAQAGRYSL